MGSTNLLNLHFINVKSLEPLYNQLQPKAYLIIFSVEFLYSLIIKTHLIMKGWEIESQFKIQYLKTNKMSTSYLIFWNFS